MLTINKYRKYLCIKNIKIKISYLLRQMIELFDSVFDEPQFINDVAPTCNFYVLYALHLRICPSTSEHGQSSGVWPMSKRRQINLF